MYNAENVIINALDSVKNQTFPQERFEIIVVNDGSTDKSREVVESYIQNNSDLKIQLINKENGGVSTARNAGLKIAEGNFIALLDSDDEWYPQKIEHQMRYLSNGNLNVDFITSGYFDENQRYSEDANYWMRISEKNEMYLLSEKLVIAGSGKKSFGFSGLSSNLKEMEKGIQKNIREMYKTQRINALGYVFYFVISKFKYWMRPLRAKL